MESKSLDEITVFFSKKPTDDHLVIAKSLLKNFGENHSRENIIIGVVFPVEASIFSDEILEKIVEDIVFQCKNTFIRGVNVLSINVQEKVDSLRIRPAFRLTLKQYVPTND